MNHVHDEYDDTCPGCQPVLVDPTTMKRLPDDDPSVVAIMKIWAILSLEEKKAFFRVTVKNSRAREDLDVMFNIQRLLKSQTAVKGQSDASRSTEDQQGACTLKND